MDGGAWWAAVHGVAKSQTQLSDFTFPFHLHASEKEMAAHSSGLENPRDGGAWWAAVSGVVQSRTWLKRLSSSISSVDICMVYFCALFHSIVVLVDIFSNSKFNFIMTLHIQWLNFPILIIFTMVLFSVYLLHIYANFRISLWISTFKKLQCFGGAWDGGNTLNYGINLLSL